MTKEMKTLRSVATGRRSKGLTLLELVIVLGVIGLVSGVIWATASSVRSRQPIQDSVQLVSEIATNVRGVYTGFRDAASPSLQTQIDRGFFPLAIVNKAKNDTINAWGGTVRLTFPAPMTGFSVEFTLPDALPATERREVCLGMISRMQGTAAVDPATNSAYATAGTLPSGGALPALDPAQGVGPALVFINTGSWVNVTGVSVGSLFGSSGSDECEGFAYYYRL